MSKQLKELKQVRELLKAEKEEDFEQFKKLIQRLSLQERKEKGYTWYPVTINKSGYTYGDRVFVILERKESDEEPHHFRSGKVVNLFTLSAEVRHPERTAVVQFVEKNRMKIILNVTDLPDWLREGNIGVDLLFDERTYLEMEKAMDKVISAKGNRLAELRDILLGVQAAKFDPTPYTINIPTLNNSQNAAVNQVLASRDIAIIHGPPGTGKTTTLVQAVKVICETEKTVLVTAPSNTAVDLLTERLADEGLNVVRIGNISRVDENIIRHTLDFKLSQHPDNKNIKKVKIEAAESRRKARRYKRRFGKEQYDERRHLLKEAKELMSWANELEERLLDQLIEGAQVVTCTLVGVTQRVLENLKFRTVVIDEAAQALEPASWIPIVRASKVVLAGDPFQLPPTVKSVEAKQNGFNITLIEKGIQRISAHSLLEVQYRMNEVIMGFSNQHFYNNVLKAAETVKDHRLLIEKNHPLVFIDTAGCGFDEEINEAYQSRYNPMEFQILCEHLYQLINAYEDQDYPTITLISPYREQAIFMKQSIQEDEKLAQVPLVVSTIDGFQGQESDVIYISLVRSNEKGEIGFLKDYRRMNVAMTRARKLLVVVGDSATIGGSDFYGAFLDYCDTKGKYMTAWEFMK